MEGKKQTTFLSIIGFATLLFAIVGATFAYFSITVRGNEEASSVIIQTTNVGEIVFTDGAEINLQDAYPGNYATKTFTIAATDWGTDMHIPYYVYLDQVTNEFADNNITAFKHKIESSSVSDGAAAGYALGTLEETTVPAKSSTSPIFEGLLVGNSTHTYTYWIGLLEMNVDQNEAQGRTFIGKLRVTAGGTRYTAYGSIWSSSSSSE